MPKIKKIYVGTNLVRPKKIQTFDFQNDWALSWVWTSVGYWTPALTSWQWWYIGSSSGSYQWQITPPSSIFGWNLKSIKIWFYRPLGTTSNRGFGVWTDGTNARVEYGRFGSTSGRLNVYYSSSDHRSNVQDLTWEIEMDIILESNWHITINLINNWNTYSYDGGACASEFQSERENSWVVLEIARWNYSSTGYIRKVEITTLG